MVHVRTWMQVDTSGEDTKSGVDAEEAVTLATHILTNCPHLKLKGTCLYFFMFSSPLS